LPSISVRQAASRSGSIGAPPKVSAAVIFADPAGGSVARRTRDVCLEVGGSDSDGPADPDRSDLAMSYQLPCHGTAHGQALGYVFETQ
jgi:hypothetical protein